MDGQTGRGAVDFDAAFVMSVAPDASDFDELGHVNNVVYLRWVQDAATTHWRTVAPTDMQDAWVWVALRHEIDYRDPIVPGEGAEVRTWLGVASGPRFDRFVDIRKPGAKRFSARSRTVWCMVDAATRKPSRVTQDVLAAFDVTGEDA
ncbi:MAG: thioesterase family protein [Pseudomonadota bacterium]